MRNRPADDLDQLTWKWGSGTTTAKADFGNPLSTTTYRLCVYDVAGGAPGLRMSAAAPAAAVCRGKPCWRQRATGFKYTNRTLSPDGLLKVVLKAGGPGAAKIVVKGKGVHLALPALPVSPPVTIQLQATNGICWDAVFSTVLANNSATFRAKSD